MEDWTIGVEDFGRIARADVVVKPLTVLVGSNNSGKSYLASLVWGIEHGGLQEIEDGSAVGSVFEAWLGAARAAPKQWVSWPEQSREQLQRAWPKILEGHTPALCRRLFDTEGVRPGHLEVDPHGFGRTWCARVEELVDTYSGDHDVTTFCSTSGQKPSEDDDGVSFLDSGVDDPEELGTLVGYMTGLGQHHGLSSEYGNEDAIFLPASRTGFSLFLPTFVQSTLSATLTQPRPSKLRRNGKRGEHSSPSARFTLPQVHLLSALASAFGGTPGPYADEADRLERECLDGAISARSETGVPRYAFSPRGTQAELGLQLTSALVTELMPLVVALRNAQTIPFLVLEEPEAHLHPRLVRAVTRCLCRLVRRGVRVLITTHSATVAQQVNNLVKLGALDPDVRAEQQQRLGYDAAEYLEPSEVGVHEFRFRDDGRTIVEQIAPGPVGFPMPTFNRELQAFADETLALNELLDPEPPE